MCSSIAYYFFAFAGLLFNDSYLVLHIIYLEKKILFDILSNNIYGLQTTIFEKLSSFALHPAESINIFFFFLFACKSN